MKRAYSVLFLISQYGDDILSKLFIIVLLIVIYAI